MEAYRIGSRADHCYYQHWVVADSAIDALNFVVEQVSNIASENNVWDGFNTVSIERDFMEVDATGKGDKAPFLVKQIQLPQMFLMGEESETEHAIVAYTDEEALEYYRNLFNDTVIAAMLEEDMEDLDSTESPARYLPPDSMIDLGETGHPQVWMTGDVIQFLVSKGVQFPMHLGDLAFLGFVIETEYGSKCVRMLLNRNEFLETFLRDQKPFPFEKALS